MDFCGVLNQAWANAIQTADWMDAETRTAALGKLSEVCALLSICGSVFF
jgi:hypothetical protein